MSTNNIIRIVQLTMLIAVAAFGISVVVFGHWWSSPPPKVDLDSVGKQVISGMQNQFDTGEGTKDWGVQVLTGSITLINVTGTGNEYQGMVHVTTQKLTDVPVSFTLYADATTWMYQIDQQSLIKLSTIAEKDKGQ
jgi:hypothetical protein